MRIKNITKLSQLNGSWSGVISLRLDMGKYEMKTYVIIHIMCNPRRGVNRCAEDTLLEDCNESDNKLCLLDEHHNETCGRMDKNVSDWSDGKISTLNIFNYFSTKDIISFGFPISKCFLHLNCPTLRKFT